MKHLPRLIACASIASLLTACGSSAYTGTPPEPDDYDRTCESTQDCALITYSPPCNVGCTAHIAVSTGDEDQARAEIDAYVEHYASGAGQCTGFSECYTTQDVEVGCADGVCVAFAAPEP